MKKKSVSASRLAIIGIAYLVSLAAAFALVPPEVAQYGVVAPLAAAASLMLFFGPSTPLPRFFNHPEIVVVNLRQL